MTKYRWNGDDQFYSEVVLEDEVIEDIAKGLYDRDPAVDHNWSWDMAPEIMKNMFRNRARTIPDDMKPMFRSKE